TLFLIVLWLAPLPMSWSCEYAKMMEVIAGSWLVLTHCTTNRDIFRVGTSPGRTSKTASRRKTGFVVKTSLCVKKLTKPRCLKRSLEPFAKAFDGEERAGQCKGWVTIRSVTTYHRRPRRRNAIVH